MQFTQQNGQEAEWTTRHLLRSFVVGAVFATVCLVASGNLFSSEVQPTRKNAVVTGLPVVTKSGAKVTVECPLSAALQNPKGQFIGLTSFSVLKNEVDTHGCPGVVGKYGTHNKFVYYTPQSCDSTASEVTVRFYGHYAFENDRITVKSDGSMTCGRTNGAGTFGNIHGFNCDFQSFEMLRRAPQLPYIRESAGKTALDMVNLVRQDGVCPNVILVSTDGSEEYQFEKISNCQGWQDNGHGFWTKGFNIFPNGNMLEIMTWQANSAASSPFHMTQFGLYGANLKTIKSSNWIYVNGVMDVAELNSFNIPFTKTWTYRESGIKFKW